MITTRLKIPLEEIEYSALLKMADEELRNPTDQARFILRQEFERRGLLVGEQNTNVTEESEQRWKNATS